MHWDCRAVDRAGSASPRTGSSGSWWNVSECEPVGNPRHGNRRNLKGWLVTPAVDSRIVVGKHQDGCRRAGVGREPAEAWRPEPSVRRHPGSAGLGSVIAPGTGMGDSPAAHRLAAAWVLGAAGPTGVPRANRWRLTSDATGSLPSPGFPSAGPLRRGRPAGPWTIRLWGCRRGTGRMANQRVSPGTDAAHAGAPGGADASFGCRCAPGQTGHVGWPLIAGFVRPATERLVNGRFCSRGRAGC